MLAIFLDMETTGLDFFRHRAVNLAIKIVDISTGNVKHAYQVVIKQSLEVWERRDPVSMEINGFTWEKIQTGIEEEQVRQEIIEIFSDLGILRGRAFYICQNPAFDRSFFSQIIDVYTQERLNWPYHWLDFASMFWALRVKQAIQSHEPLPIEINLSKNAIAEYYSLPIEEYPHSAVNGVDHLILCYQTVIGFGNLVNLAPPSLIKYDE